MNLAGLFGDDEHTGRDDAYVRILKSRKWLVLAAALSFGWSHGFLDPKKFTILIADVTLPGWIWTQATFAGLAYSLIIYVLLMMQLVVRYRKVLRDRHIEQASQRIIELQKRHDTLNATYFQIRESGQVNSPTENEAIMDQLKSIVEELRANREEMQKEAWNLARERHPAYMIPEYTIDAIRVVSPLAFGLAALAHLL